MLIENQVVHCLHAVKDEDIDTIICICTSDFYNKLYSMTKKSIECTLKNYREFAKLGRNVSYNTKNIVFKTSTNNDLRDFYCERVSCEDCCSDDIIDYDNRQKFWNEKPFEYFGKGEFPFMQIYIVRIGNTDHSFYTISR